MVRAEQALERDSRVLLGEERDAFGLRRIRLDWRLGELDYATMRRGVALARQYSPNRASAG